MAAKPTCATTLIDRHLAARRDQKVLVCISTEVDQQKHYTYRELHAEMNRFAAVLQSVGVGRGDRVIVYMPMIPEVAFAIFACARIGAIHSVVFGGFAAARRCCRRHAWVSCCAARPRRSLKGAIRTT